MTIISILNMREASLKQQQNNNNNNNSSSSSITSSSSNNQSNKIELTEILPKDGSTETKFAAPPLQTISTSARADH